MMIVARFCFQGVNRKKIFSFESANSFFLRLIMTSGLTVSRVWGIMTKIVQKGFPFITEISYLGKKIF